MAATVGPAEAGALTTFSRRATKILGVAIGYGLADDIRDAYVSFDVTESLLAGSAGAPNMGWVLLPGGGNGWPHSGQFAYPQATSAWHF